MLRTPLYDLHRALGGRMVEFAGWEMPVQYSGVIDEHRAVRTAAGHCTSRLRRFCRESRLRSGSTQARLSNARRLPRRLAARTRSEQRD